MHNQSAEILALLVLIILFAVAISVIVGAFKSVFSYVTVFEFQRGILYRDGKMDRVLEAGRYLIRKWNETITIVDVREQVVSVTNQELICADSFSIRLSASVVFRIADAVLSNQQARSTYELLYLDTQLVMREVLAGLKVDDVIAQRNDLSAALEAGLKPRSLAYGVEVVRAGIRDVTLPADVKKAFTQVGQAEKSAQAQLAKSRAETASLRALANAAKLIESNPNLLALRSLQSISELAATTGNTIVLGVPSPMVPIGGSNGSANQSQDSTGETE